jgi:hypothetical protein
VTRWWLTLADRANGASAAALARDEHGAPVGTLAAWARPGKPLRSALRVDGRIVDGDGEAAWVSLVLAPEGVRLPFDDVVVQQARRDFLAGVPADAVSTLLRDNSTFAGAITVARGPDARHALRRDPFARIFPARILQVDSGLLGRVPAPVGPSIERYGSENPWPWERFS